MKPVRTSKPRPLSGNRGAPQSLGFAPNDQPAWRPKQVSVRRWLGDKSLACSQALPPGFVIPTGAKRSGGPAVFSLSIRPDGSQLKSRPTPLSSREVVTLLVFRPNRSSFKRICYPDRSEAQWRTCGFSLSIRPDGSQLKSRLSPLSSRAKPRDLRCAPALAQWPGFVSSHTDSYVLGLLSVVPAGLNLERVALYGRYKFCRLKQFEDK